MSPNIGWGAILLRLGCAVIAGTLIGINRGERARPAGLRTSLLVCLAAAMAMLEANLLLATNGKASDSFVNFDVMRLPLGILSGMGFIGAGAIIHRENLVEGVTTAATMWYTTMIGICLGGGQLGLGGVAAGLGLAILWGLKPLEKSWKRDQRATLSVLSEAQGPDEAFIEALLRGEKLEVRNWSVSFDNALHQRHISCALHWRGYPAKPPELVRLLARAPGVREVHWQP